MLVLAIEDDEDFQATLIAAAGDDGDIEITFFTTAEAGLAAVRADPTHWDLVICDLKIPSAEDVTAAIEHGLALYKTVASEFPGLPIRILSAFGTFEIANALGAYARQDDPFGEGFNRQMVMPFSKYQVPELIADLKTMAASRKTLDTIEVDPGSSSLSLSQAEKRVLRIYGQRHNGRVVHVRSLAGGLSSSTTLRVAVDDAAGTRTSTVVAKVSTMPRVVDERARYLRFVAPALNATAFAPMASFITAGVGDLGGLFYSVAEPSEQLIQIIESDALRAARIVSSLEAAMQPWHTGVAVGPSTVGDVRRGQIDDDEFARIAHYLHGIPHAAAETLDLQTTNCTTHGDLHGGNVLVIQEDRPVLIDYGRTGSGIGATDPVMLELSLVLHPDGQAFLAPWPTEADLTNWDDLDRFAGSSRVGAFIEACRHWAHKSAAGNREVLAAAYGYAVRQVKFDRTDRRLAIALIRRLVNRLMDEEQT